MWNEELKDSLVGWIAKNSNLEIDKDKSYDNFFEYDFVTDNLEEFCNILFHKDKNFVEIKIIGYKNKIDFKLSKKIENESNILEEIKKLLLFFIKN